MKRTFMLFWCVAGLLTLDIALRTSPARETRAPALDSLPLVTALRTRCELPAGTVVFVVQRDEEEGR